MRISTKGRYAVRVMIELAKNYSAVFHPLRDLALRQGISEKYLENILGGLMRAKILKGVRGKGGGYRMNVKPEDCSVWDVLKHTEKSVAPVECLDTNDNKCSRADVCYALPCWVELYELIKNYLKGIKISQLVQKEPKCIEALNAKGELEGLSICLTVKNSESC